MKKLISIALALVLVFSLATVAMAAPAEQKTFEKNYTVNGATNEALYPKETLRFDVSKVSGMSDKMITVGNDGTTDANKKNTFEITGRTNNITINLPAYGAADVGTTVYKIDELDTNSAGVTYSQDTFNVTVLVTWVDPADHDKGVEASSIEFTTDKVGGGKVDSFTNIYNVGSLSVKKMVDGLLGNQDADNEFDIDVVLTSRKPVVSDVYDPEATDVVLKWEEKTDSTGRYWEAKTTLSLHHNETVTIDNIPYGVTYTVIEQTKHGVVEGKDQTNLKNEGYVVSGEVANATEIGETNSVTITNTKGGSINTGVILDSAPYILLMVVAVMGIALVATKKQTREF